VKQRTKGIADAQNDSHEISKYSKQGKKDQRNTSDVCAETVTDSVETIGRLDKLARTERPETRRQTDRKTDLVRHELL